MSLGNTRAMNGGREWQNSFLAIELHRNQLAYRITLAPGCVAERKLLWLTGSNSQLTLPFVESYCYLEHLGRGRWAATSEWDGRVMARGCSVTDVVGKVIKATYNVPRSEWPSTPEHQTN